MGSRTGRQTGECPGDICLSQALHVAEEEPDHLPVTGGSLRIRFVPLGGLLILVCSGCVLVLNESPCSTVFGGAWVSFNL